MSMRLQVSVGDDVMAPQPQPSGQTILKTAKLLLLMPDLAIVEYYESGKRHCLPKRDLRAPFNGEAVSHALAAQ